MAKRKSLLERRKYCYFCVNGIHDVDYKDINTLRKFMSSYNKIVPRRRSGLCSKYQRKVAESIKRARYMGLLPYTAK